MGFAERLRLLRLARGYTQESLAEAIGHHVTKQALSQYERGRARPSPKTLRLLANALRVEPAELLRDPEVNTQIIAFRCRKRLCEQERAQIEQIVCWELEQRLKVERLLGICTRVPLQAFPVHTEADAEKAANQLRQQWQLGFAPIANMVETLEAHGVHVVTVEASDAFEGVAAVARDELGVPVGAAVAIRKGLSGERQRLSLAHELGHLVLKVSEQLDEEKIAFRFGAAFLTPADALLHEIGHRRADISLSELLILKHRYGMSLQAILYRLRDLSVIRESYYKAWMRLISQNGWRRREPEPLPEETPQRFRQLLLRAVAEQLLRVEEAERMLGEPLQVELARPPSVRRTLLLLPREMRLRVLEAHAESAAHDYLTETDERAHWQGGDFIDEPKP